MYGTRDAAINRERDWQGHLGKLGYELVRSSRSLCADRIVKGRVLELKKWRESVHPIKANIIGAGSAKSIKALNRRKRWRETGTVYQNDQSGAREWEYSANSNG